MSIGLLNAGRAVSYLIAPPAHIVTARRVAFGHELK
jgi:hypothetical protein